jgi:hypothetical protein
MGIFDDNRVKIGNITMQQFKSADPNEKKFTTEQKNAIITGKEFSFDVYLELNENENDFFHKAQIFVENQSDKLEVDELPIFPVTIITAINIPLEFRPKYIETWMPICGTIENINHFYKSTPKEWSNLLRSVKYFSDNWNKYRVV